MKTSMLPRKKRKERKNAPNQLVCSCIAERFSSTCLVPLQKTDLNQCKPALAWFINQTGILFLFRFTQKERVFSLRFVFLNRNRYKRNRALLHILIWSFFKSSFREKKTTQKGKHTENSLFLVLAFSKFGEPCMRRNLIPTITVSHFGGTRIRGARH